MPGTTPVYEWLFSGAGVTAIAAFVAWLYRRRVKQGTASVSDASVIVDHELRPFVSPPPKWLKPVKIGGAFLAVALLACAAWEYHNKTRLLPPLPPGGVSVRVAYPVPMTLSRGKIVRLEESELPCSYGRKTGLGLEGLSSLPADLKRPYLTIEPTTFLLEATSDNQTIYNLFFETEVTNRGEPSIAKGWRLCIVQASGKPIEFKPEQFTPDKYTELGNGAVSLIDASNSLIEHGRLAKGWLLFKIPKDAITPSSFSGSLQCRDYRDRQSFFNFKANWIYIDAH
jgi:hypothetical protein